MDRVRLAAEKLIQLVDIRGESPEVRNAIYELQLALSATQVAAAYMHQRPQVDDMRDAAQVLSSSHRAGNYILISPTGSVYETKEVNQMLAIVVSLIDINELKFSTQNWNIKNG